MFPARPAYQVASESERPALRVAPEHLPVDLLVETDEKGLAPPDRGRAQASGRTEESFEQLLVRRLRLLQVETDDLLALGDKNPCRLRCDGKGVLGTELDLVGDDQFLDLVVDLRKEPLRSLGTRSPVAVVVPVDDFAHDRLLRSQLFSLMASSRRSSASRYPSIPRPSTDATQDGRITLVLRQASRAEIFDKCTSTTGFAKSSKASLRA